MVMRTDDRGERRSSFALDKDGNRIDIVDAQSGLHDYLCPCEDCKTAMVAVKCTKRRAFFRHYAKDVQWKARCTYSDAKERSKIAKEILARIKSIKVPSVFKEPPPGVEGNPKRLRGPQIINAYKVEAAVYFYEDQNFNIGASHKQDTPLLKEVFKADIVFLDQTEKAILLIELVEKERRITDAERGYLRAIGIDAVQVRIPTESQAAIEAVFKKTNNTKWIYNNECERTPYKLPVSPELGESVPDSDEHQSGFLGESTRCRASQIANLVRAINKCLESEPYATASRALNDAIRRVKEETSQLADDTHETRSRVSQELAVEFEHEERAIDAGRANLSKKSLRLDRITEQLEKRYSRKRSKIEAEQINVTAEINKQRPEYGNIADQRAREAKQQVDREGEQIERNIETEERNIERIQAGEKELRARFREKENNLGFEPAQARKGFDRLKEKYEALAGEEDGQPASNVLERITGDADIGRLALHFEEDHRTCGRLRRALECLTSGTYKTWYSGN